MHANLAVEVSGITKKYGDFTAVDDISFSVAEGEIFGSLGPNGAGKTTLIRMLTTLIKPTSGDARVAGCEVVRHPEEVRRQIGVVPQAMTSDLDLTAYENMDIYGRFYSIPTRERLQRIDALLETVGLLSRANDLVASFSGGMRRRLEIARVLIHKPKILFLDEPTTGLDPQSRRVIWDFIQQFREGDAMTIFLTTHYMEEAEEFCDRVAIIDHGRIVVIGSPAELKAQIPGSDTLSLRIENISEPLTDRIRELPFVWSISVEGDLLRASVDNGAQNLMELLANIKDLGATVLAATIHEQSLEDVFIHHTGKALRDETKKVDFLIGAGVPRSLRR
nr:ATP-binding cassette domain-containing protein [uncultured Desulfobulbus sp.]